MSDHQATAGADATKRRGKRTTPTSGSFPTKGELFERNAEDIQNFPTFPNEKWANLEVIAYLEDCCVQTLYRRSKLGTGPRIVTIGGQARVNVGEYRRLNAARLAAAAQPEPMAA